MARRVLLIMPAFFNYPQVVQDELKSIGFDVLWFDDRPSTNSMIKALLRINRDILKSIIDVYFKQIIQSAHDFGCNIVLIISGQSLSLSRENLVQLRHEFPEAKFVLYQWDSLSNFSYILRMHDIFDRLFTFDRRDAQIYNMEFCPLFYHRGYVNKINHNIDYIYDISYIGTAHPKKYQTSHNLIDRLGTIFPKRYFYHYLPSRLVYIRHKLLAPEYRNARLSEFNFSPLDCRQTEDIVFASRCIFDSPQDGQLGLTIRTIECLGAERKLITTNQDIVNYDFYRPENIYVFRGTIDINDIFFNSDYIHISDEIRKYYTLNHWLRRILNDY